MTIPQSTQSVKSQSIRVALLLAVAFIGGCGHKPASVNPASLGPTATTQPTMPTATLTADPLAIDLGQSVVLNWRTTDATSVTIDGIGPVNVNGTQTVSPSSSTNFHLTAKGDGGTVEANVRVTVRVPVAPTPPAETSAPTPIVEMGSDEAFHQNVPDIFFDYDSYELRAGGARRLRPRRQLTWWRTPTSASSSAATATTAARRSTTWRWARTAPTPPRPRWSTQAWPRAAIRVVSFGKEKQFCTEETEACWQQNRRAQFSLDQLIFKP